MRLIAIIAVVGAGQHLAPPGLPPYLAKLIGAFIVHLGGIVLCGGGRRFI